MSNRAIDRHEDAICEVLDRIEYEDECLEEAALVVAEENGMSQERMMHLVRVWCAVAGIEVPG